MPVMFYHVPMSIQPFKFYITELCRDFCITRILSAIIGSSMNYLFFGNDHVEITQILHSNFCLI